MYFVVKDYTNLFCDVNSSILHFAPEKTIYQKLCHRQGYITDDIKPGKADTVVDIKICNSMTMNLTISYVIMLWNMLF